MTDDTKDKRVIVESFRPREVIQKSMTPKLPVGGSVTPQTPETTSQGRPTTKPPPSSDD